MSNKVDAILGGLSDLLEKHLGGELRRNARSITASVGPEPAHYVVRVRVKEKKARRKTVAAKTKRQAKKAAA